jgi:cytochrome c-type biogenesis protein CcmH
MRFFLLILLLLATPVFAVEPDEILADTALEQRARNISKGLRCLVCRNENIDSSHAGIAKDLRLLVRERLVAGDTDAQTIDFVVDRYGEFVLLKPRFSAENAGLYLMGPIMLVFGAGLVFFYLRRRARANVPISDLSQSEADRLAALLND